MRDIRILSMMMRDENVPATPSTIDDNIMAATPTESDENENDKPVKRFAERIPQLGPAMHDRKEKD